MGDLVGFLCGLAFGLAVIAVVGHMLWLGAAWLLRQLTGQPEDTGRPCSACGARFGVRAGRCLVCGAVPGVSATPKLRDELTTTSRQLRRLLDGGAISQRQYDEIVAVIQVELAILTPPFGQAAAPIPSLAPRSADRPAPAAGAPPAEADLVIDAELVEIAAEVPPPVVAPLPAQSPFAAPAAPPPAISPPPVHPLDRPYVPPPPKPVQPRRSLAEIIQSFMEESNIRWMEIIAAVCIVISSVGLVWSLRSTLKAIPYFPAGLFTLFTLAFHGAGLYTLRKWKLHAVSRVILVIAQLLVPLSFAGAIVMSGSGESLRDATDPTFLGVLALGLAAFGWVCYSGSRELAGSNAWPLAIGVLGCSASQVLIHRAGLAGLDFWRLCAIAALPLGSYLVATIAQLVRARRWPQLSRGRVNQILLVLGISTFALSAPLALLVLRAEPRWQAIARLSPSLSLAAAAVLALGLLIHRRTTAKNLATYRTAGTALLVLSGVVMLLLVAFTWPEPELLLAVGLLNCVVLALLGIVAQLPLLYVPATACAALAATIGLHLAGGHFDQREHLAQKVIQALLMGRTSAVLATLAVALVAISGWLHRRRAGCAQMLLLCTGGLMVVGSLVSLFSGFVPVAGWPQDRDVSAGMLLLYAAALLAAAPLEIVRISLREMLPISEREDDRGLQLALAGAGSALLWVALVQALALNPMIREWFRANHMPLARPVLIATILHGVLTAILAAAMTGRSPRGLLLTKLLAQPLDIGAAISLTVATPFLFWIPGGDFDTPALLATLAAAGWLLLAISQTWPWAISAFQAMLALAPALFVAGVWKARSDAADWWLAEEHLLAQLMLGALAAIVWGAIRRLTSEREAFRRLLTAPWPAVDQVLLGVAVIGLPVVAMMLAVPPAGWELGFGEALPQTLRSTEGDLIGPLARGWIALAVVLAALAVSLWERITLPATIGIGIASYAAVWLGAAHFESVIGVASAARWSAAIYAAVLAAAYIFRDELRAAAKRLTLLRWSRFPADARPFFAAQPLVFGGLTILILTIVAVSQNAGGVALSGPVAGSIFDAMGLTASYAGPLIVLVAALLGYAVRERQAGYALGGAAVFQLAINLAFILHVALTARQPADVRGVEWLQWNSVAAGIYALVWLGLARWITPPTAAELEKRIATLLWVLPVGVGAVLAVALSAWAAVTIVDGPQSPAAVIVPLGHWLSYAAVGLVLTAGCLKLWAIRSASRQQAFTPPGLGDAAAWSLAALVPLMAASLDRLDRGGQFVAYHALEIGWLAVAAVAGGLACAAAWRRGSGVFGGQSSAIIEGLSPPKTPDPIWFVPRHFSAALLAALVVFLAIRANRIDPAQPWWSLACVLACGAIATALGLARRSQPYAFASTGLAGLAVVLFWNAPAAAPWIQTLFGTGGFGGAAGAEVLILAAVAMAGFWLWREIRSQQRDSQSLDVRRWMPRVHAAVCSGLVPLYFLVRLAYGLFVELPFPLAGYDAVAAVATAAMSSLLLATLWDRRAVWSLPLAYVWGLAAWWLAIALARQWLPQPGPRLTAVLLAVAGHVALTGQVWSFGANLAAWGGKLGVSDPIGGLSRTARWLPVINLLLVFGVCLADLALVLNLTDLKFRVATAFGPAVAAWGVLCLAQERRRDALQLAALVIIAYSAVLLGWSELSGHTARIWMERVFRLLMVLAAVTFAYGLVLPRWLLTSGSWNAATRKAGYIAGAAAIAAFIATLVFEVSLFRPGIGADVAAPQVIAIAVVLVALIAGLISLALLPGRDPLLLDENWKQAYVYAAQAVAALLFAHLYVCRPQWFDGILRPYWPFIVMGLAFLGVGAAELFHRWKIRVLAEPLQHTGALLPLLPVIGWWAGGTQVDYALLLLIVGILYLGLSFTRKSWAAMIAAAVAGNGALWSLFNDTGFNFAAHPQLWLIPPALSVLAAAQVNRHRLPAEALTAIRYAATIVIYVSSTSEIVIRGLGVSLLPPMILLALSVVGAFAGIALRVRAFLYLGASFTLLALTSMVWHASRSIEHVWPLWAFGIFLGVGILMLLVLFEKNKAEMHQLIARLRKWEQ